MGLTAQAGRRAFRRYVTDGVPASGENEPDKGEIIDAWEVADYEINLALNGSVDGVRWTTAIIHASATANVNLANGLEAGDILDGVTLVAGNSVLVPYQTDPTQNGLYTVPASGAASRAAFAATAADLAHIAFVVQGGTTGRGIRWTFPADEADIVVGTTNISFAQIGIEPGYAAEVEQARALYPTLGARLDNFDDRIDSAQNIAAAEGRAAAYGVTDPVAAADFAARSAEMLFDVGYFRKGFSVSDDPLAAAGVTFARASVATWETAPGVVTNFASGAPRYVKGLGLLVEPTGAQLLRFTSDFANVWDRAGTGVGSIPVITSDDAMAPDGTMTADKIVMTLNGGTAAGDRSVIFQTVTTVTAANYAHSVFVKGVAGQKLGFRGVSGGSYAVHTFSGSWERWNRVEAAGATTGPLEIELRGTVGTSNAITFHMWGANIMRGDFVTSYMPSDNVALTRAADDFYINGLSLDEGCSILTDVVLTGGGSNLGLGLRVFFAAYVGTDNRNMVTLVNETGGGLGAVVEVNAAVTGVSRSADIALVNATEQVGVRIKKDDVQMVRNGKPASWVFDAAVPTVTTVAVGATPRTPTARVGGIIKSLVVVPIALSDSELINRTGGEALPVVPEAGWERVKKAAAFSTRDSAKTFKLGGNQYIANGYYPTGTTVRKDVWKSPDGINYTLVNAAPPYDDFSQVIAFNGVMYAFRTGMWKSLDAGVTWTKILNTLPWGVSSYDNPALVHKAKMLFIHGTGATPGATDGVWQYDPTGNAWSRIAAAPWGARDIPVAAEFKGDLYLFGGTRTVANVPAEVTYPTLTTLNDLWKSADGGVTWTLVSASLPLAPRIWPAFIAFEDRLYLMAGYDNIGPANNNYADTWVSDDGINWRLLATAPNYLQRHAPVAYTFNGRLYLVSGNANTQAPGIVLNDIWRLVSPV